MPLLRGPVTFARFLAERPDGAPPELKRTFLKTLQARAFEPLDRKGDEERAAGFVEVEAPDGTGFSPGAVYAGEHARVGWRVDSLKVAARDLKGELDRWAAAFEQEQGRPPARGERARQRAELRHTLRARATPRTRVHDISWNLATHEVLVWAASRKQVEEIQGALEEAFGVKLTGRVPAAAAARAGVSEDALAPTPELSGVEGAVEEVSHGKA